MQINGRNLALRTVRAMFFAAPIEHWLLVAQQTKVVGDTSKLDSEGREILKQRIRQRVVQAGRNHGDSAMV